MLIVPSYLFHHGLPLSLIWRVHRSTSKLEMLETLVFLCFVSLLQFPDSPHNSPPHRFLTIPSQRDKQHVFPAEAWLLAQLAFPIQPEPCQTQPLYPGQQFQEQWELFRESDPPPYKIYTSTFHYSLEAATPQPPQCSRFV